MRRSGLPLTAKERPGPSSSLKSSPVPCPACRTGIICPIRARMHDAGAFGCGHGLKMLRAGVVDSADVDAISPTRVHRRNFTMRRVLSAAILGLLACGAAIAEKDDQIMG